MSGITFSQFDLFDVRTDDAATNQQLPSWPWRTSCDPVPSTTSLGFLHISFKYNLN